MDDITKTIMQGITFTHRLSSSPDLRFPGFAWPSQGNPNDRLSPHAEPPRIQWRYRS